ncbi:MAG: hypothetical protein COX20_05880 [Desulfobacterales bacterium CG23_combo_of_CG06-09_8_20_14_all_52_9]|nr:MAG: hypothetical protein COX20_05880 [Desulfobacterales bacterium CG23_combo_of_CG06-09_8_20_14_all_52_9]
MRSGEADADPLFFILYLLLSRDDRLSRDRRQDLFFHRKLTVKNIRDLFTFNLSIAVFSYYFFQASV